MTTLLPPPKSGIDHCCFPPFSSVTRLLLRWHFYSDLIHQGIIDLLAAAMLHLSIKLSCQITWRLRNSSLHNRTWKRLACSHDHPLSFSWKIPQELTSWSRGYITLTTAPSPIAIPFLLTISPSTGIFNGIITLHIQYRSPPERHGSLSPWPS